MFSRSSRRPAPSRTCFLGQILPPLPAFLGPVACLLIVLVTPVMRATAAELIMVEQDGCVYCIAWKKTIGPIYPKTPEGIFAPLRLADLHEGPPPNTNYARAVTFTPTFILVENNQEIGRIEGYPGEDFFWWMLEKLLTNTTEFAPQKPTPALPVRDAN